MRKILLKILLKTANKLGYNELNLISVGTTSRIHKGEVAGYGKIWYVLKVCYKGSEYINAICFSSGLDNDKKYIIYFNLLSQIKNKYIL
jgi:hypothetical protein